MACQKPLRAYMPATGGRVRMWSKKDPAYWVEPYTGLAVPCGTCILCREEQARQWAVRITHEAQLWDESSFITLTYADEHLPPHNSLRYADLQKFWKRLRKQIGQLRYYAVGEYGDDTHRPHYHACLFGHAFTDQRRILRDQPTLLWTHPILERSWGLGNVSVGALNFETARYTAGYVTKKLRSKQKYVRTDEETGELIPVEQPRAFISKRIGYEWLQRYGHSTYDHDRVVINGTPQKPTRYYDNWLKANDPHKAEKTKEERLKHKQTYTPEQLTARARNAHARNRQKIKTV